MDSPNEEPEEYIIEAVREWRYNDREKTMEFLVKWSGWPEEDNTWEPEENLDHCEDTKNKFLKTLSSKEKAYYDQALVDPSKLEGFQRNAEFVRCVGADISKTEALKLKYKPNGFDSDASDEDIDYSKFYLLAMFKDSDLAEEVTIDEFYQKQPEELLCFFEQRILVENNDKAVRPTRSAQ